MAQKHHQNRIRQVVIKFSYLCPPNIVFTFMELHFTGLVIAVATFVIIGVFHPLVIKGEYYFGVGCWWVFLVAGLITLGAALAVENVIWSTLLAIISASSFWSIRELFQQRERVRKGWFPKRDKH